MWTKQGAGGVTSFSLSAVAGKQTVPGSNPNSYINAYRVRFDGTNYWLDYNYGSFGTWSVDCQLSATKNWCGSTPFVHRSVSIAGILEVGASGSTSVVLMPWQ